VSRSAPRPVLKLCMNACLRFWRSGKQFSMPLPWLILLSDPEGLKLTAPPRAITRAALDMILDVAESHGVLPATVSNLSAARAKGCAELVASGGKEDLES